ncbi:MAG: RDD family protein, partial [Chloroflexi bacterium]
MDFRNPVREDSQPAAFGSRAIAYLIDSAAALLICGAAFLVASFCAAIPGVHDLFITVAVVVVFSLPLIWFAYQWLFNSLGWSPGKRALSIVVQKDFGSYLLPHPGP